MTEQLIPPPQTPARELSACRKGELAETLFIAGAMVHDWEIFTPFGHAQTADLCLVRPGGRPITVQVKTATLDRGAYHVSVKRSSRGGSPRPYIVGDFDVLAAYLPDRNEFVLWTFGDILGRVSVRYSPDKHRDPNNWHLLDEVAESLTAHQKSFTP
jgi:hypothetical protein